MAGLMTCMPKSASKPQKRPSRGVKPEMVSDLMSRLRAVERAAADLRVFLKSFQDDGIKTIPCEAGGFESALKGIGRVHSSIARNQAQAQ
jgi:hypothetical protein